jgi:hypothetical protein
MFEEYETVTDPQPLAHVRLTLEHAFDYDRARKEAL